MRLLSEVCACLCLRSARVVSVEQLAISRRRHADTSQNALQGAFSCRCFPVRLTDMSSWSACVIGCSLLSRVTS